MAETIAISLKVDSGNSVNEVKKLEDAIKEVNNSSSTVSLEDKFKTLNTTLKSNTATFGEMSQAIEAYKTIALNAGRESPIGQEALKNAAMLKDRITDLDREVDNLAKDGQSLQGALQIGTGAIAGYQAFAGVTALVGEENEELMETMVKLQASMSVLQSIEQIRLATEKESLAIRTLKNAQLKITIALQKAYALAVGAGTKAVKLLRLAMVSLGLGALVVTIGLIIAKWNDWKDSILKIINVAFYPLIKVLQFIGVIETDLEKERRINSENQLERIRKETEALEGTQKIYEDNLRHEIAIAKARGENTEKLEDKLTAKTIQGAKDRIAYYADEIDTLNELNREGDEERIKSLEDSIDKANALIKSETNALAVERAKRTKQEQDELDKRRKQSQDAWEKRKADKIKQDEEEERLAQEKEDKELEYQRELEDLIIANEQDFATRKIAEMMLNNERELQALRDKYGYETDLEKELILQQKTELDSFVAELELTAKEKEAEDRAYWDGVEEADRKERVDASLDADAKMLQSTIDAENAKVSVKQAALNATSAVLSGLSSLFSENEKVQKAAALTQIAIDTAVGFTSGLRIAQESASGTGPAAAFTFPLFYATQIGAVLSAAGQAKSLLGGGSGVSAPTSSVTSAVNPYSETSTFTDTSGEVAPTTSSSKIYLVESELQMMQDRRSQNEIISIV